MLEWLSRKLGWGRPVFTTSFPGFLGSTENNNRDFILKMQGRRRRSKYLRKENDQVTLYIHGALEDELGYDIPIWLSGYISEKPIQPCKVWNVRADKCFDAYIVMMWDQECDRWLGYIVHDSEIAKTTADLVSHLYGYRK